MTITAGSADRFVWIIFQAKMNPTLGGKWSWEVAVPDPAFNSDLGGTQAAAGLWDQLEAGQHAMSRKHSRQGSDDGGRHLSSRRSLRIRLRS